MDLAALLLSLISLLTSITTLVWQLAKHFSTHRIEFRPLDIGISAEIDPQAADKNNPSMSEIYKTIDQIDPDEEDYFKKHNLKNRLQSLG